MNTRATMLCLAAVASAVACSSRPLVDEGGAATSTSGATETGTSTTSTTSSAEVSTHATTSTGADTSTSSDPGVSGFIDRPDVGGIVECDIWAQDCPVGQKCMPWSNDGGSSWTALRCSPIADDPGQPGDPCTVEGSSFSGIDDCDLRSMCWDVDPETLTGHCVAFCVGSEANAICENACEQCNVSGASVLILCLPSCDPIAQDCNEGDACYPVNDTFACAPDASGDLGAPGDPCEFLNVCDPGLFCAAAETVPGCTELAGCCAPFCDAEAPDVCDALLPGTVCVPIYEEGMGPIGCVDHLVGGCMLPP